MFRTFVALAIVVVLMLTSTRMAICQTDKQGQKPKPEIVRCDTAVDWYSDNATAFKAARRFGKPVYVLHLSGNLLNEKFT